jgi:type IV secretory pathway VirB2 component (pilin)
MTMKRYVVMLALLLACVAVVPVVVHAQAANPWEQPLTDISTSVTGPVALAAFLIALCIFCFTWWMGYTAIGAAVGLVVAGAIVGNADTIASWLGIS